MTRQEDAERLRKRFNERAELVKMEAVPPDAEALYWAAMDNDLPALTALLDKGISNESYVNIVMEKSLLHIAAENGYADMARLLVSRNPEAVFYGDSRMGDPLIRAIENKHTEVVRILLDAGADTRYCGLYPATEAAKYNRPKEMRDAVAKADRKFQLFDAAKQGNVKLARELLASGEPVDVVNRFGYTPLIIACKEKQVEVARIFARHGADPERRAKTGDTPMSAAVGNRNAELIAILAEAGASVQRKAADYLSSPIELANNKNWPVDMPDEMRALIRDLNDKEIDRWAQDAVRLQDSTTKMKPFSLKPRT